MTDWLLDTLIWTSALMLLVLAVREPVRRQFGAGVAYALWAIPAARILMPTLTHTVERAAPAPLALPAGGDTIVPALTKTPLLASATRVPVEPSLFEQLGGWPIILGTLWVAGAIALFGNRYVSYLKERQRILAEAEPVGHAGAIRIVRSPAVEGPLAFGIIDRVIAVPAHFDTHFTPSERHLALEHELAHHRSGDLIANFIAFVLLSLQWFNPLAWASYAAFRFDQEAACDARVLDRADDPAAYGRAIAKAASGRALLFASALDSKTTLKRRLKSMINTTPRSRRRAGNLLVLGCVAVALPLTATKAVEYVERPVPSAPTAPVAPTAPAAPVAPSTPVAPVAPVAPVLASSVAIQDYGDSKPYSQMTAEEREEFDQGISELREALDEIREERVDVRAEIAESMAEARMDKAEMREEMEDARREILEAREELKAERAEMIAEGVDPAVVDASIQAALASLEAINVEAIMESAMAAVDEDAIQASVEASMAAAEASIRASLAEMEERRRQ